MSISDADRIELLKWQVELLQWERDNFERQIDYLRTIIRLVGHHHEHNWGYDWSEIIDIMKREDKRVAHQEYDLS